MDSRKTPGGLQDQFLESFWTPDGVHQDSWLSVMTSIIWRCMGYSVCGDTGRPQWIWRGSKQRCFHFRFVLIRTGSRIKLDLGSLSGTVGLGPILSMLRRVWMHSSRNVSRLSWKYPITTVFGHLVRGTVVE